MISNRSITIFTLFTICSCLLSSCNLNNYSTFYSLDELQKRRESGTLTTLVGRRAIVSGQVTRVYRSKDTKQGFYTIQNGSAALFGEFSQDIDSTSLIQKGNNIIVYAAFRDFPSFHDLSLSISNYDNYVTLSSIDYPVNYLYEGSSKESMLRYFGCMFHMDSCFSTWQKLIMNNASNIAKISKPFYFKDLRLQLYPGCDIYDINVFDYNIWLEEIEYIDTPLLIKEYNGYLLVSLLNVYDMLPQ